MARRLNENIVKPIDWCQSKNHFESLANNSVALFIVMFSCGCGIAYIDVHLPKKVIHLVHTEEFIMKYVCHCRPCRSWNIQRKKYYMRREKDVDASASSRGWSCSLTATETKDKVKGALLLDVVIRKSAAVLELLASENETLLVRRDALLILDLRLHVVDRVRGLDLERDRLAGEGLDEDLHAATKTENCEKGRGLAHGRTAK